MGLIMADIKDILPLTKKLSLLYIDEDQEFLSNVTTQLSKIFASVDDANDSTVGISYAKLNTYDLIIVDSISSVMNVNQLVKNLKYINQYQNVIITTKETSSETLLKFYEECEPKRYFHQNKISLLLDLRHHQPFSKRS